MLELAIQSNVYGSLYVVFAEGGAIAPLALPLDLPLEVVFTVCSKSTTIGAGPDPSIFCLAYSRPKLWLAMCAMVPAHAATSSTLERKRSGFEAKTPHLALKGVES